MLPDKCPQMSLTQQQPAQDRYRLILLRASGTEVLVVITENGFTYPEVEMPRSERVPENLRNAMSKDWNQDIVCLGQLGAVSATGLRYLVAETLGESVLTQNCVWVQVVSLKRSSFVHSADVQALHGWFARGSDVSGTTKMGPFAKSGWFEEVRAWVAAQIEPLGLRMTGAFRQLNAGTTFSLLRFETNGPALWFKAVDQSNRREFDASLALARFFPGFVPQIVAFRQEWHAWLTVESPGNHPNQNSNTETWTTVATALADLQIASVGHIQHLIAAGCRDLRPATLEDLVSPFFELMSELMDRQRKHTPPRLSRPELGDLCSVLRKALHSYSQLEIPNTLGHLDFNLGNIIVSESHCVFLDWAEAYIGPPFLTCEYLLAYLRRQNKLTVESAICSTYTVRWINLFSRDAIIVAIKIARLLAVFAYATSVAAGHPPKKLEDSGSASFLRSLTRQMQSEAEFLNGVTKFALPRAPAILIT